MMCADLLVNMVGQYGESLSLYCINLLESYFIMETLIFAPVIVLAATENTLHSLCITG